MRRSGVRFISPAPMKSRVCHYENSSRPFVFGCEVAADVVGLLRRHPAAGRARTCDRYVPSRSVRAVSNGFTAVEVSTKINIKKVNPEVVSCSHRRLDLYDDELNPIQDNQSSVGVSMQLAIGDMMTPWCSWQLTVNFIKHLS